MDEQARKDSLKHTLLMLLPIAALLAWTGWKRHKTNVAFGSWFHGASGYTAAVSEHQRTKQPVLVYFHTEWCGYCKKLDAAIFSQPQFLQNATDIIKVSINPDTGQAERGITDQWQVQGYPTLFVVGNWGRPALPFEDYTDVSVDEFIARVRGLAQTQQSNRNPPHAVAASGQSGPPLSQ